jgi:NAD+ synthase
MLDNAGIGDNRKLDEKKVLKKITRFLNKEVKSRNAKCVVIGISGGIDSTVTAYLSAHSLGCDKVLGLLLPDYSVTPKIDVKHGLEISKKLNIKYELIDIGKDKKQFIKTFPKNKLAKANFLVRLRMAILYYYAAANGGIVVGTANKSELQLGYFTKYGDGGADIFPIADLYKTEVRKIASYLDVPQDIIKKQSSARLWKGQTAEGEIGVSYETIDKILYQIDFDKILRNSPVPDILGVDKKDVRTVIDWIKNNRHKHELPVPKCKLTFR